MVEPTRPSVGILMDPDDDVTVTQGLLHRHDPAAGRIVVHPTATTRHLRSLGHDLLAALGAPVAAIGQERLGNTARAWRAVRAWLIADQVEHLVVLRAHLLEPRTWTNLAWLAHMTGTRLLLVCHSRTITAARRTAISGYPIIVFHDLPTALHAIGWDTSAHHQPAAGPGRRYAALPSQLPMAAVPYYRADLHRQCDPATFTRVDALYGHGLDAACLWLPDQPGPQARQTRPAGPAIEQFLTDLVYDCPTPRHTLAILRGVQAGFLLHGFWLDLPTMSGLCGPGLTSEAFTDDTVTRIRAGVAHPMLAAGIAIALITGLCPETLRHMPANVIDLPDVVQLPYKLTQVEEHRWGSPRRAPRDGMVTFHVPPAARPLLDAARAFTPTSTNPNRQPSRLLVGFQPAPQLLTVAAARCGLRLPGDWATLKRAWQMRVTWTGLDTAIHTSEPTTARPGAACLTATAPAPHPAAEAVHLDPWFDVLRARWRPTDPPHVIPALVQAHLDGTAPSMWAHRYETPPQPDRNRRLTLVSRHLAVRIPPRDRQWPDEITVHPDITFALRLTDRPAAPDPTSTPSPESSGPATPPGL